MLFMFMKDIVFKEIGIRGRREYRGWRSGCAGCLVNGSDEARREELGKGLLNNIDSPTCRSKSDCQPGLRVNAHQSGVPTRNPGFQAKCFDLARVQSQGVVESEHLGQKDGETRYPSTRLETQWLRSVGDNMIVKRVGEV
jgi:hypothetical protein